MAEAAGDTRRQEQFLRLFLQHQVQIDAYVRSMVPHRADAEELLQDVAAVLWRKFEDFVPGTRFDHWACRVAHNQMLYYFRRKRREALLFSEQVLAALAEETLQQNDLWAERRDALASCMQHLATNDRVLVQGRFQAGSTNRSLARQMGRSESSVSRALNRIYASLLECIRRRIEIAAKGGLP